MALIFAVGRRVSLGLVSAIRRNSTADVGTMVIANLGVSIPVFVLGLILAFLFAVAPEGHAVRLAPVRAADARRHRSIPLATVWGLEDLTGLPADGPRLRLEACTSSTRILTLDGEAASPTPFRHLILPAIALGTIPLAIIARITRSSLLEVLGLDYVRTARAKGAERALGRAPPRAAQRHAARRHDHRPAARRAAVGRGPDRDHLQPDRAWARRCSRRSTAATTASSRASTLVIAVDLRRRQPASSTSPTPSSTRGSGST